ncbi:NGFI-A-binding protein homolog [Atheta coriaria]|uniref:NGFI-A-binding protein homolog n=1 Tax=Dalotia coriaria TaxID=877792 RepID=UPI0031F365EB
MVNEMDSNSNHSEHSVEEVVRRAATPTSTTTNGLARQSPKITTSTLLTSPPTPVAQATVALVRNTSSPASVISRKVMSRNHNNTLFPTSFPSNLAELQLFRVMQNASLLYYYDTLLEMGGDDVQQLCDAGEEEFLEIMSLVGMASKPLHVRRFQKSLQEWVNNPIKFKTPLTPGDDFELERIPQQQPVNSINNLPNVGNQQYTFEETARTLYAASPASPSSQPCPITSNKRPYSPLDAPNSCPPSSSSSPGSCTSLPLLSGTSGSNVTPSLPESHVGKLAAAAERLSKQLPQFEPKPQNNKKKMCKELELVMSMADNDPRRMDEIRRYAAIYGRFDCKRRPEKPLTLHEVSVNEAAAQICRFIPALLTRRDELFPLARQVVKDSGCHYSKTGAGYTMCLRTSQSDLVDTLNNSNSKDSSKRRFDDGGFEEDAPAQKRHQEYLNNARSSIHFSASLLHSKSHTSTRMCSIGPGTDDEAELHYSLSNSCSNSPLQESEKIDSADALEEEDVKLMLDATDTSREKFSPRVQVIAASGDNIIAVANPALALSPAMLPLSTI